jgi:hypothetical protein
MTENSAPHFRENALWRHYDAAIDKGAILVAVARCRLTDREPLYRLRRRHHVQLVELLHEFCYHARKAIELADTVQPGAISHAKEISLLGYGETSTELDMDHTVGLASESLWWVLGRIIHSREVAVHEREEIEVGSRWAAAPRLTSYVSPIVFSVRSDHDAPEERHFVHAERLVECFLALQDRLDKAIQSLGETPL